MSRSQYVTPLARILSILEEQGSVALSKVPKGVTSGINQLVDARVLFLHDESGRRSYRVTSSEGLGAYIRKHYPGGLFSNTDDALTARVKGVVERRDSKTRQGLGFGLCLIKAKPGITLSKINQKGTTIFRFDDAVPDIGGLACHLDEYSSWKVSSAATTVVSIENPDTFVRPLSDLPGDVAVFADGIMSQFQLDFITQIAAKTELVHFGDYDPVGLAEYLRLKNNEPKTKLYIPDDLSERFKMYSNADILQKGRNQSLLTTLRQSKNPDVGRVVRLILDNNSCLEQEACFI